MRQGSMDDEISFSSRGGCERDLEWLQFHALHKFTENFLPFLFFPSFYEYHLNIIIHSYLVAWTVVKLVSLVAWKGWEVCGRVYKREREKEIKRARRVASLTKFRMSPSETLTSLSLSFYCSKLSLEFRMRITGNISQATQAVQSMAIFNIIATFGLSFSLFGKQGKNPFIAMI